MGQELAVLPEKRGPGAPRREYDPLVGDLICQELSASSEPLSRLLASRSDLPKWETVRRWEDENPSFKEQLDRARDDRLALVADNLLALSDEARGKPTEVQAIKLQIQTRQWLLSKLASHTYGDKLDLTSKGEALQPASHQIDARVQSIVMQAARRLDAAEASALSDEARSLLD